MPPRLYIAPEVMLDLPGFSRDEIRSILNVKINSMNTVMRKADIFRFKLQKVGVLRSHGKKRPKSYQKIKEKDRLRKRKS